MSILTFTPCKSLEVLELHYLTELIHNSLLYKKKRTQSYIYKVHPNLLYIDHQTFAHDVEPLLKYLAGKVRVNIINKPLGVSLV